MYKIRKNQHKKIIMRNGVPLLEILSDSFFQEQTQFLNIYDFFMKAGHPITCREDINNIPLYVIDQFVSTYTIFLNFEHMQKEATKHFLRNLMKRSYS